MYAPSPAGVFFRPAHAEDLEQIACLEAEGYPADEAASKETLRFRLSKAGGAFLVALQQADSPGSSNSSQPAPVSDEVVGFVCGTLTRADKLTHDSMQQHDEDGSTLCIHSVCVDQQHRRKGIALRMLQAYLMMVQHTLPQVHTLRLICKEDLIGLYSSAGFSMVGPSDLQHGKDPWFDMALEFAEDGQDAEQTNGV